ncbi:SLAM family member 5-like [Pituophis catenifer annectens]|uniref:SLAM family member 5-like n=1 Tax=Pituophis catenifer annectens TaxID=94852 RepID=UPI0039944266
MHQQSSILEPFSLSSQRFSGSLRVRNGILGKSRGPTLNVFCGPAGVCGREELYGDLGYSVTFRLMKPPPYQNIYWSKGIGNNSINIAVVNFREPCHLQRSHAAYKKRLWVSKDCQKLALMNLKKEDAGTYTADIVLQNTTAKESFNLQVCRKLPDSELRLTCISKGAGNGTWQLICSQETWKGEVNLRWISDFYATDETLGSSVMELTSQDLELIVTCEGESKDSIASRTVTLKEVCAGQTKNPSRLPLWALLCLSKVGNLLLLGCLGLLLVVKSRKAAGGRRMLVRFLPASQRRPRPPARHLSSMSNPTDGCD